MLTLIKVVGMSAIALQFLCFMAAILIIARTSSSFAANLSSRRSRAEYWRLVSSAALPGRKWMGLVAESEVAQVEQHRRRMTWAVLLLGLSVAVRPALVGGLKLWLWLCG